MIDFSRHFHMQETDAVEYVKTKLDFFAPDAVLKSSEIGDGNINYVFRVEEEKTAKSIIIKHADNYTRSSSRLLSIERSRIEAAALILEGRFAPDLVPKVYLYDSVMNCIVMEDLRHFKNMRYALIEHDVFPGFADHITTFLAETLIRTSSCIMNAGEKKKMVKDFINPELCEITERLVYTEPYTNASGKNNFFKQNEQFLTEELYHDESLLPEVAALKFSFENKTQSLIHGDLHTGSIFVTPEKTMVIDPEFAFAGPAGYDIGNIIANLIFAWSNAVLTMTDLNRQAVFIKWLEDAICMVIDGFAEKAMKILSTDTLDPIYNSVQFKKCFVNDILADTAGVTGLELNRRIIGVAKVKDITGITDPFQRMMAERICVLTGKQCIMNRKTMFQKGKDYVDILYSVKEKLLRKN